MQRFYKTLEMREIGVWPWVWISGRCIGLPCGCSRDRTERDKERGGGRQSVLSVVTYTQNH